MKSNANTKTAGGNGNKTKWGAPSSATLPPTPSSSNSHALLKSTSLGKPSQRLWSSPNHQSTELLGQPALWGSLAPVTDREERGGTLLPGVLPNPANPPTTDFSRREMYRLKPQLQPHLLPPGSSYRESSRPVPRRRRRGCSGSASAAWSAPRRRRPLSPAGPSWKKTRSSRGTRYEASWRLGRGDRSASRAAMVPRDPRELTPASLTWSGPDVAFLATEGLHSLGRRGSGKRKGSRQWRSGTRLLDGKVRSLARRELRFPEAVAASQSWRPPLSGRCC